MKKTIVAPSIATALLCLGGNAWAITTNDAPSPGELVSELLGPDITPSNITLKCAAGASGRFSDGSVSIGFEKGIILSSGNIANIAGPNKSNGITQGNNAPGDVDLDSLVAAKTQDSCVLEFDFKVDPAIGVAVADVSFQYVFASDEYNKADESAGSNDAFGFFVDGKNVALIPDSDEAVSIDSVNGQESSELYRDNTGAAIDTEMDGLTTVLATKEIRVIPGETHHVKLAIADAGNDQVDSNVFIKAGSFRHEYAASDAAAVSDQEEAVTSRAASVSAYSSAATAPASQEGEALTPFQKKMQETIKQRKASGLPVPSVKYESQVVEEDAAQGGAAAQSSTSRQSAMATQQASSMSLSKAAGQASTAASTPTNPLKIINKTIIQFDNPQQAGQDEWPALVVKDNLPPNAHGTVKAGDYTEAYREFMEEKSPGIWEQYEFGQEPRTHTIEETVEITEPEKLLTAAGFKAGAKLSADTATVEQLLAAAAAAANEQLLMGFTYTGPHIDYSIGDKSEALGLTIYEFKAGFELDWALGLRLPGEANLTGPDQLVQGTSADLASAFTPLDWSATSYSNTGVASESGNEFVLRMNFFAGVKAIILEINVCPNCYLEANVDKSKSFTTPFGAGASFPIPTATIPVYNWDLGFASFGVGLSVDPDLGSDKVTANWQASGDASGSGTLRYSSPSSPVSFGAVNACNLSAGNQAAIQLDGFRYWFNQFLINLGASLNFKLFGYGVWGGNVPIATFDLSPLTDGLYLSKHTQCSWNFQCSAAGPDNTLNMSIPVVDLTPPSTSLTPSGTAGSNGWYTSDVQVSLSAEDFPAGCGNGVKQIEYSFDGSSWTAYSGPITISSEGLTTVYYRSVDNDNNIETTKTQVFRIDKTPPTITGAATATPNAFGWYKTDVVVHFTASDAVSGIDILTPDQTLSAEGASQSVTGTAVDKAGLSAFFTVTGINIDKTKPNVAIANPTAKTYSNTETFNVSWTAKDSLSGIAKEIGALDGTAVTNGQLITLLIYAPGQHTLIVNAEDKADNPNSASVTFNVTVDSKGLLTSLEFMRSLGWIRNNGVCNGLAAKLKAAIASTKKGTKKNKIKAAENQLRAFLNQLNAQKGKAVNQQAYDVLKASTLYVIEHLADEVK
uniref:choice-of-anchor L domain-containing protein n=1 Tax=Candidatus Electronema sp. TaxID=2698783 RepID=UPI004057C0A7